MELILNCQFLSKSFGSKQLFKDLSFSIFSGDKIGLIGPNGSGKSTLLKILFGIEKSDFGQVSLKQKLKIGYVPQACDFPKISSQDVLLEALKLDREMSDYEKEHLAKTWLSKSGLGNEPTADLLSGGWKKRLSIAKEMLFSPDLLLLDEPTNHLDLEGLFWLEKFLAKEVKTYLLVSHDRYFLQNATNKIIEIANCYPNGLFLSDGAYSDFLERKNQFLEGQIQQERSIASKARKEEAWLKKGARARTTKSRSRIEQANNVLEELSQIKDRNRQKTAEIDFSSNERQTRKLLVAKNIAKKIGNNTLFEHLDFTLAPGMKMGLIGPNGSGKTTLLKILAEELMPDQGTIKRADNLEVVYFDQHRAALPNDITLREALCPNDEYVLFRGQKIHVNGWCKRFLFSPDILNMPIAKLSGGERARISIAHLLLKPADVLLLDEPTNDLDIPTLEILEESFLDFPGAIVLITHDRSMIDRVCNVILALGDLKNTQLYVDYAQWEASRKNRVKEKTLEGVQEATLPKKSKLSYAEKQEYEQIEGKIAKLEEEVKQLSQLLESSEISQDPKRLEEVCNALAIGENQIEQLFLRWEELDQKKR